MTAQWIATLAVLAFIVLAGLILAGVRWAFKPNRGRYDMWER